MGAHHPWYVLLPAVLVVAVLFVANRWIAGRFRRRFNPGLVTAAAAIGVLGIIAAFVVNGQQHQNDDLTSGSFRTVVDGADARTAANDAKANESLRLISRGSGQAFEDAWTAAAALVDQQLQEPALASLGGSWTTYKSAHQQVVDLDNGGKWDDAVALATNPDDGPTPAFTDFDSRLQDAVASSGTQTTSALDSGNSVLLVLAGLAILIALAGAGLASTGVNRRLKEYS
jgi:hypothetical protein